MKTDHLKHPENSSWGYLPLTERMELIFDQIGQLATDVKTITEIGFHAGHSTTYLLETFPEATIYTHGLSNPSREAAIMMKSVYGDRFNFYHKDSMTLSPNRYNNIDFAYIDGNHQFEIVCNDIIKSLAWGARYVLVDNMERRDVSYITTTILGEYHSTFEYSPSDDENKVNILNYYEVQRNNF